MRILVTGGTGFVGCHTVKALQDDGHEVRLLVRAPERVAAALGPLGAGDVETVTGDVTDEAAVREAADGCDAALHAASVYRLSQRKAAEMASVNPRGTEVTLGVAHELGLDPIVHVSSYVALLPPPPGALGPDAPVGRPAGPYARSKAASEAIARRFQGQGAPVVITYPGAVWGPDDPHLGETSRIALAILRGRLPVIPAGPMSLVDVRDVAAVHAAMMRRDGGPSRLLLVAEDTPFAELFAIARRATGRRLPALPLPRASDAALRKLRRVPGNLEGPWYTAQGARTDASAARAVLGRAFRTAEESVLDTLRWLHSAGHLDRRRAGRLASGG